MRRKYAELSQIADVILGCSPKSTERHAEGEYKLLTGKNLGDLGLRSLETDEYVNSSSIPNFEKVVLKENDIILSILFEQKKLYLYKTHDSKAVAASSLAIIRPKGDTYIRDYLNTVAGRERLQQEAARKTGGGTIARLNISDLRQIRIPILQPDEIQELADRQHELTGNELLGLISKGESTRQEFKSTLRRNLKTRENDPRMEDAVLKTIAAFCNSDGGNLLIGVADNGEIVGLEEDGFKNTDKFVLHLMNLVRDRLKPSPKGLVDPQIKMYASQSVCIVRCERSSNEIWLYPKTQQDDPKLFIREGPSSKSLQGPEITRYVRKRFT